MINARSPGRHRWGNPRPDGWAPAPAKTADEMGLMQRAADAALRRLAGHLQCSTSNQLALVLESRLASASVGAMMSGAMAGEFDPWELRIFC